MHFNTENAQVFINCRKTGEQISFHCGLDLDWDDIRDLHVFFLNTLCTPDAKRLVDSFETFHDRVNYDRVFNDFTGDYYCLQEISDQLDVNGYDLFIDGIIYE